MRKWVRIKRRTSLHHFTHREEKEEEQEETKKGVEESNRSRKGPLKISEEESRKG